MKRTGLTVLLLIVLGFVGCGGGGGGTSSAGGSSSGSTTPLILTITTDSTLPATLQGQPYSATLVAINGQGALKWSIAPQTPTALFLDGLSIDSASGVLSGTSKFQGTAGFIATVTDASSKTAVKSFTVTASGALVAGSDKSVAAGQWNFVGVDLGTRGGVAPLNYFVSSGSLPPGVRVDKNGYVTGSPSQPGNYSAVITVKDSWTTPESATQKVDFTVTTANLALTADIPILFVNQPSQGSFHPAGGVPPYQFKIVAGAAPAGMSLDTSTGKLTGIPTTISKNTLVAQVTDSVGTKMTAYGYANVTGSRGRNDTPQTATLLLSNSIASLSPYIDPPNKAPAAADNDFYKMPSIAGTTVTVKATTTTTLADPVLEITDANGVRMATCNTPDSISTSFTSPCVNDEDNTGGHNASLDVKVPGNPGDVVYIYIHVLDWSGNARPDMQYYVLASGTNTVAYNANVGAIRGQALTYDFNLYLGAGPDTWSVNGGPLPNGLSLSSSGRLSGTPTVTGQFVIPMKVVDSSNPVQTFYVFANLTIGEPLQITSPATWPTACVGQPYVFTLQTTPNLFNLNPNWYSTLPIGYLDYTGVFSATPIAAGTYTGKIVAGGYLGGTVSQDVTLTVQNCP
jgi:hypothetical protein